MGTILRPTRISIRIYGWRQDRLVDPIEIGCTNSPTLRLRTCGRPVVSQLLGALNRYQVASLRSSWPCNNIRLISSKNMSKLGKLWTTPLNGHGHEITDGWYVCASFLVVWSRERPASSSSSATIVLV